MINKILIEKYCKKIFLNEHPELEGSTITSNQLITSLIRFYLQDEYESYRSLAEGELYRNKS